MANMITAHPDHEIRLMLDFLVIKRVLCGAGTSLAADFVMSISALCVVTSVESGTLTRRGGCYPPSRMAHRPVVETEDLMTIWVGRLTFQTNEPHCWCIKWVLERLEKAVSVAA